MLPIQNHVQSSPLACTLSRLPSMAAQQRKGMHTCSAVQKAQCRVSDACPCWLLAECPFRSLPGFMAPMARLQQLATSNISKYPQKASPDSLACAPKGSLDRLSVADQVRETLMRVCPYMSCR